MMHIAIEAAQAAGQIIKQNYEKMHTVSYKDAHNIVSETDVEAESAILKSIRENFPDHSIFSEEAGNENHESDYLWIIDPLDGTTNFTHHLGHCAVSIALTHRGHTQVAVVYDPLTEELFTAERGKGAFLNEQPITPSPTAELAKTLVLLSRGGEPIEKQRHATLYQALSGEVRSMRVLGSTALGLCYVASGRCDALVNNGCKFYDYAAGLLIAGEAKATISDFKDQPLPPIGERATKDIVASTQALHPSFISLIQAV